LKPKNYFPQIILAIIAVNAIGYLLRLNEIEPFIILIGFRFHISLALPFFFIVNRLKFDKIKSDFINPLYKQNYPFVLSLLILPIIIYTALYIAGYIELADPEYFYELGLSSLADLPVYLVWNSAQLVLLFLFLSFISEKFNTAWLIPLIIVSLLVFEFIPIETKDTDIAGIISLIILSLTASLLIIRIKNIYWFCIFIFLILWQFILLFGSKSSTLIKILFASQYNSWEGFFEFHGVAVEYIKYLFPVYLAIVSFTLFITSIRAKKGKMVL
jgi:hypothetical protein